MELPPAHQLTRTATLSAKAAAQLTFAEAPRASPAGAEKVEQFSGDRPLALAPGEARGGAGTGPSARAAAGPAARAAAGPVAMRHGGQGLGTVRPLHHRPRRGPRPRSPATISTRADSEFSAVVALTMAGGYGIVHWRFIN